MPKFRSSRPAPFQKYLRVINEAADMHWGGTLPPDFDPQAEYDSTLKWSANVKLNAEKWGLTAEVNRILAGRGLGFMTEAALEAYDAELERQEREKYIESISTPEAVAGDLALVYVEDVDGEVKNSLYQRERIIRKLAYDNELAKADPTTFNLANKFLREIEAREAEQRMAKAAAEQTKTEYESLQMSIAAIKAQLQQVPKPAEKPKAAPVPSIEVDIDKLIKEFKVESQKLGKRFESLEKAVKERAAIGPEMLKLQTLQVAPPVIDVTMHPTVCDSCIGELYLRRIYERKAKELGKPVASLDSDERREAENAPLEDEKGYVAEALRQTEIALRRKPTDAEKNATTLNTIQERRSELFKEVEQLIRTGPEYAECIKWRNLELESALKLVPGMPSDKYFYELCDKHVRTFPAYQDLNTIPLWVGFLIESSNASESTFTNLGIPKDFVLDSVSQYRERARRAS